MNHPFDIFNPWHELHRVRRALGQSYSHNNQPISVWIGEDGAKLRAVLPGITPDELDISVLGKVVTLRGQREQVTDEDVTYIRRERDTGAFHRQVELPFRVDAQAVHAAYTDGILTVTLPRSVADKPQRIAVQAA